LFDLTSNVVKFAVDLKSSPLADIFSTSAQTGTLSDRLKIGNVIPIFKSGDTSSISNYRPISMINILSKVFEKLIHERLLAFFTKKNFFNPNQFTFF